MSGPEGSVLQVDYNEIGIYLSALARRMLKSKLTYQYPTFLMYEENLFQSVLKTLRYKAQGHMQDLYGPSPKWFENVSLGQGSFWVQSSDRSAKAKPQV